AATNRDLATLVKEGKFRDDLYYRLNVVRIVLPSLAERREDIPMLAQHFLQKYAKQSLHVKGFLPETMALLKRYRWPGNVRELENAVERAVSLSHGPLLLPEDLPEAVRNESASTTVSQDSLVGTDQNVLLTLDEVEKRHLARVLKETKGNKVKAAKILGIDRRTLYRMAERFGLDLGEEAEEK
ncbi:sigma-54-dependent Fis family transcriptional regulator, partial [Nitrospirales bacterium NOB]|nr:sigma-54-dependent Fis family transcriptional regulator [Nitrospirales bacterium NOB]